MNFLQSLIIGLILSVAPMTLYAGNNSSDQHLSHEGSAVAPVSPITIGVLGDSLSAGYGIKTEQGWVTLLQHQLKQAGIAAKVINSSVSGATTDAGLQMQAGLLQNAPDIVILALGANDGLQGKPLALIEQNLSVLISRAQSAGAKVLLLGIQLPPNLGRRYTEPFFAQYRTLAQQYNIARVPFFLEGVAGVPDLMQTDGLHPNAQAQPLILNNIWPVLQTLIAQVSPPDIK
ncbi:arylesterase [Marinagarivorans algicola]|uniref:arylesterase n=1 Tax=Marinagarivorans algicola TaxID=1513270 RepID=UPI0037361DE2